MKMALIPPRGMEMDCHRNTVQLSLAQNNWPEYNNAYGKAADRGDYIIVDNGAAENAIVTDLELMDAASRLCASEIVVPDVMWRCEDTIVRCMQFFEKVRDHAHLNMYTYMGVVQGKTMDDMFKCAEAYHSNHRIRTLGIPRHLIKTMGSNTARVDVSLALAGRYGTRFAFHLLGTDRSYLKELYYVGRYHNWIRSVDTSAPYIYAAVNKLLPYAPAEPVTEMSRPQNYFAADFDLNSLIVKHNVEVLNAWCRGERA